MSGLSKNRKWIVYTALILWSLTILVVFSTAVLLKVAVRLFGFPGSMNATLWSSVLILVIAVLIYAPITVPLQIIDRFLGTNLTRKRYVLLLALALLVASYAAAWVLDIKWNLLSLSDLIDILYFSNMFSTGFTAVAIPVSLYFFKRK